MQFVAPVFIARPRCNIRVRVCSRHLMLLRQKERKQCRFQMSSASRSAVATELSEHYGSLVPYKPPEWASNLSIVPTHRYVLSMRPTPIHQWGLDGVPTDFHLGIKRDDMTGITLSGNKVRAMEFHLADVKARGCDMVVTAGPLQSNHCRTTAIACRLLGLETHLLLKTESADGLGFEGNMLLNRMSGAHIVPLTPDLMQGKFLKDCLNEYSKKLRSKGRKPYIIPVGGHSLVGLWGYIELFRELLNQGVSERFSDILLCSTSGCTSSGIAIANYLTGSKLKVHGVVNGRCPIEPLQQDLNILGLEHVVASDILDVIHGYIGKGYGIADRQLKELMVDVFATTSISLDTTYTAKAVQGLLGELRKNPSRFQGKNVLFIHTGGVFTTFDGSLNEVVETNEVASRVVSFND